MCGKWIHRQTRRSGDFIGEHVTQKMGSEIVNSLLFSFETEKHCTVIQWLEGGDIFETYLFGRLLI